MTDQTNSSIAVVAGVGPGLGHSLCLRFAREGYSVAALARRTESLQTSVDDAAELKGSVRAFSCDVTDADSLADVFSTIHRDMGRPAVGIYNAGTFRPGGILELDPETFETCWRVNCHGAFLFARASRWRAKSGRRAFTWRIRSSTVKSTARRYGRSFPSGTRTASSIRTPLPRPIGSCTGSRRRPGPWSWTCDPASSASSCRSPDEAQRHPGP